MKRIFALLCCLAPVALSATETLWVYGVNQHYGWYDADKSSEKDANGVWVDNNKCWAAVSANLINWWQSQYDLGEAASGIPHASGAWDKNTTEVWETYRGGTKPIMSSAQIGIDWWWTGSLNEDAKFWEEEYPEFGIVSPFTKDASYYKNIAPAGYHAADYITYTNKEDGDYPSPERLYYALKSEDRIGIGLNLVDESSGGHGITVWGAEFDVDGDAITLKALWVTDSDDAIAVYGDHDLFRVSVGVENGDLVLTDYWSTAKYIDSLTFLNATATDAWGMQFVGIDIPAVPEPATATLSLLALAGLAVRRRRR